jgi:predicted transposase YbfD/YdcC
MGVIRAKFSKIRDKRHRSYVEYPLIDVLILIMCAILCGLDQLEDIISYGKNKADFLKKAFGINKIPSKPTLSRILSMIDPEEVGEIIIEIMRENVKELGEIIAVDGKSIRSTARKGKPYSALQILSAYCTESAVILGQRSITQADKTNEIPVFQEMLETLDIRGKTITADAMHCQIKTCEKIIEKCGNYCFGLKENQKKFHAEVVEYFLSEHNFDVFTTTEKHSGRFEERVCSKIKNIDCLKERHEWIGLKSVFAVKRTITTKYKTSIETNYYISSIDEKPEKLLRIVREHWKIESMHWLLDVVFSEDNCRLKNDAGQKTLNSFRKLGLLLHKKYVAAQQKKRSIKGNMLDCLIADSNLLALIK